jgi:hypothetical protein
MSARLKPFLDDLKSLGASLEPKAASCSLRMGPIQLANIDITGWVWLGKTLRDARRLGAEEAGTAYIAELAQAIGMNPSAVAEDKKASSLSALVSVSEVWRKAIFELAQAVENAGGP